MIKLLLVDDQPAVRIGLAMQIALERDMGIIGEAGDGASALALAQVLQPDVILMDLRMPGMDGLAAAAALRAIAPDSNVVMLSLYDDAQSRRQASECGCRAFIGKQEPAEVLLAAIRGTGGRVPLC
ncbi:MAG: response regulator transcription factor [Chloroflexota bacterium]|nr:response regulator transcription factor [Chloroflexota bacterium]